MKKPSKITHIITSDSPLKVVKVNAETETPPKMVMVGGGDASSARLVREGHELEDYLYGGNPPRLGKVEMRLGKVETRLQAALRLSGYGLIGLCLGLVVVATCAAALQFTFRIDALKDAAKRQCFYDGHTPQECATAQPITDDWAKTLNGYRYTTEVAK